jgi:hypothetical protein
LLMWRGHEKARAWRAGIDYRIVTERRIFPS